MSSPATALTALKRRQPEWSPWLAVVEEIQRETTDTRWEMAVPERREVLARVPLLSGAVVSIEEAAVRRLLQRLIEVGSRAGTPKMATLAHALQSELDVAALFAASIRQVNDSVAAIAMARGADPEALQAIVSLVSVPLLHACSRRWTPAIPGDWVEGYCPICGAWPAFAEVRGIERSRYLRCGRCGSEWYSRILHCAYCATTDHDELTRLVPEKAGTPGVIEACRQCRGYIKTFTRLQACAPATVMLEDLGTVDLDVAALEHGYSRPSGNACPVDITVHATAGARRFFSWNA